VVIVSLSWKDLVTSLLAALTFGLYYAMTKGIELPVITSYRIGIIFLAIIGIGMCAFSSASSGSTSPFITLASILGVVSLVLIIYGLFTGTKVAFILLTITILLLWGISTLRHFIS
jgi:EamA domain-containing membrane protein RarD